MDHKKWRKTVGKGSRGFTWLLRISALHPPAVTWADLPLPAEASVDHGALQLTADVLDTDGLREGGGQVDPRAGGLHRHGWVVVLRLTRSPLILQAMPVQARQTRGMNTKERSVRHSLVV